MALLTRLSLLQAEFMLMVGGNRYVSSHCVWRNKSSSFHENTVSVKPVLAAPVSFLDCSSSVCVVEVDTHPPFLQLLLGWGERSHPCSSWELDLGFRVESTKI